MKVRPVGYIHPEILACIVYKLNLPKVVERSGQSLARYLPVSVLHLRHSMRTDILVLREVAHSRLEEDVAVGRIVNAHGRAAPASHGHKTVETVIAEFLLRAVVPSAREQVAGGAVIVLVEAFENLVATHYPHVVLKAPSVAGPGGREIALGRGTANPNPNNKHFGNLGNKRINI